MDMAGKFIPLDNKLWKLHRAIIDKSLFLFLKVIIAYQIEHLRSKCAEADA